MEEGRRTGERQGHRCGKIYNLKCSDTKYLFPYASALFLELKFLILHFKMKTLPPTSILPHLKGRMVETAHRLRTQRVLEPS